MLLAYKGNTVMSLLQLNFKYILDFFNSRNVDNCSSLTLSEIDVCCAYILRVVLYSLKFTKKSATCWQSQEFLQYCRARCLFQHVKVHLTVSVKTLI